ncbi:MAG: 50S ribosomal protein L23 [Rhodobiaceae bacterium]|jgi:large subunit ribosomal protein L23|nr:50S ribosomal protein L23 [Rhodobiaceae bacterium]MBT5640601.1 50S ribosomal protein L23 [Rhodobiaceae bacterium]MBT6223800.1 50S ribosomal protein L23 [Rhodobiaceae bacterium]MDB4831318.1 50S ribosomal protein L23 [Hyphomicrobiales bacterium]MDC3272553.1 50S ribosomal protein L23 [Hyphomicrobiales bacterium]|tara:strand:+ start:689 stop:985 length:297 start_codon:yes stop_codon:yes gene_type:complete
MKEVDLYDVIRNPVITEKATIVSESDQVIFNVSMSATKFEIKQAVESLFEVKVLSVNTLVRKGKVKTFKGKVGKRNNTKRAFVRLAEGQTIDFTTGLS